MAKILVVDDDANNRLLLSSILKYELHTVLEAENGAVGLALASQHVPDLAIVDLHMPVIDGVTFVRRVRDDPALEHMKLALSTGTTMTSAIEDFMEVYRVEAIIPKPAEPQEILERVRVALR
jgi:CheY-like chemotaxis protein